jgi:hypothetical protein
MRRHATYYSCTRNKRFASTLEDVRRSKIRGAWSLTDAELTEQRLELLASELERT